ncbi:MAG: pknA [Phycisphaerales bacterium]|nr:pknA [Phycisphaerales bacterium]
MSSMSTLITEPGVELPKTLFGYEVLDYIGQGAGSRIYVVSHADTHQIYALKHVIRTTDRDERFVEQLEAEYEVGRLVNHPGLRRSIDVKVNRTLLRKTIDACLIMELVDGTPLESTPPKSVLDTVDCFIKVAEGLLALHQLGYVHCDLKPNNILRNGAGDVKVIDLGQACKTGTVKTRIQGTPDFISPEQVRCQEVTGRTDVFNFGATLYWCLTGRKLPTLFNIKKSETSFLVDSEIPTPRSLNPGVPETLSNFVMECVKTNPAKRPEMTDCARRLEIMQHVLLRNARPAARAHTAMHAGMIAQAG